jgi:zinc protease
MSRLALPSLRPLLAAALLASGTLSAQDFAGLRDVHTDTLANGMRIIVLRSAAAPLVTAHVVFRGGAATQTEELQGVPHLFEHMLFKAFRGDDRDTFMNAASRVGAAANGATSDEDVSYTMWSKADRLNDCLRLLADLVRDPDFKRDDLRFERAVVLDELQRNMSEPAFLLRRGVSQLQWGSWFSRQNTIGEQMSLFTTNVDKLAALYRVWYVPNNAALVVTGDVDPARVIAEARKQFGRWGRGADPFVANPVPPPPPLDSIRAFVFAHDVETVTVQLAWRLPSLTVDSVVGRAAAAVATLANAEDSPFQRALVDGGHFQSVTLDADVGRHAGELVVRGVTTPAQLLNALGMLGNTLAAMGDSAYFSADDHLAAAKRREVARAFAIENASDLAPALGTAWATYGVPRASSTSGVTLESMASVIWSHVVNKPYVIGVLAPRDQATAVAEMVTQFNNFMSEK